MPKKQLEPAAAGSLPVEFLQGPALSKAIHAMIASDAGHLDCAVAYWGGGLPPFAAPKNGHKVRVICNLSSGGTNPDVIRRLLKTDRVEVRQLDTLHAKVFVSPDAAIVGSANASVNAIGRVGDSEKLIEAGCRLANPSVVQAWFDDLWSQCKKKITETDLQKAPRVPAFKPPAVSILDIEPPEEGYLVCWWSHEGAPHKLHKRPDIDVKDLMIKVGRYTEKELVGEIEPVHGRDRELLLEGKYLLWITPKRKSRKAKLHGWVRLGGIIPNILEQNGKIKDGVLQHGAEAPPFDIKLPPFPEAFDKVIAEKRFRNIAGADPTPDEWYTEYQDQTKEFWRAIVEEARRIAARDAQPQRQKPKTGRAKG
ncbi:MAG: phospholipase D family protein [Acetobacteraceae bacterium]|nr:phospholipase D family protein [Acetobacteraceae bacterium]